jgi:hypothetical protein
VTGPTSREHGDFLFIQYSPERVEPRKKKEQGPNPACLRLHCDAKGDHPMLPSSAGRHAVVIGGSIAGLLAGQALAEAFERVTIIERDRFPKGPTFRKGVPQARHVDVLLKRGQMILEQLFPGIADELIAAGVPRVDWMADSQALGARGWLPESSSRVLNKMSHPEFLRLGTARCQPLARWTSQNSGWLTCLRDREAAIQFPASQRRGGQR